MSDGAGDDIMDRLLAIVAGIDAFKFTARNEVEIGSDAELPGCVILDGDEEDGLQDAEIGHRRTPAAPRVMYMSPLICIAAEAPARDIGRDLRALRRLVLKAVLSDAELLALASRNGGVSYRGFFSHFVVGEKIVGRMALRFKIAYVLAPDRF